MSVISPGSILALLEEIEVEDPLDFGNLPVDERMARSLVVTQLAELRENLIRARVCGEDREALLLATASRVILENLLLHVQARSDGRASAKDECEGLLAKLTIGRSRA